MPIQTGDIKLLECDTMDDTPQGGGAMTANVIIDGDSNNIFEDISTLDRVYGAVHMRKVFPSIQIQTQDKYFGSLVIISKLPTDEKIGVNLFNTDDWFDRRPEAQSRVENYRARGGIYNGFLWVTQYAGSKLVKIFQSESAAIPGIGEVLQLANSDTTFQYIRIVKLDESVIIFTDASGTFKRRVLEIEISDVLEYDFIGLEMTRYDTGNPNADIYDTVVANAAKYFSARPLAVAGVDTELSLTVDSVYSQVIPASQSEVAQIDLTAGGASAVVINSDDGSATFVTSATYGANDTLYVGSPFKVDSFSMTISGGTLVEDAGQLKSDGTIVGTVNNAEGTVSFASSSPNYSGTKTVTFTPATSPTILADTESTEVTGANRGYIWLQNISPAPQPGSVKVDFMALGDWYQLVDDGSGGLVGVVDGIGSGTIDYVSGTVSVTLAALPDVGSEVIFSWSTASEYTNRAGQTIPLLKIDRQLAQTDLDGSSLVISWNDGVARTASADTSGNITGDGTGTINLVTGLVEMYPNTVPAMSTVFTFDYSWGVRTNVNDVIAFTQNAGESITMSTGDINIEPFSFYMKWYPEFAVPNQYASRYLISRDRAVLQSIDGVNTRGENFVSYRDDGIGGLIDLDGNIVLGASINYAAGDVTFDTDVVVAFKYAGYVAHNGHFHFTGLTTADVTATGLDVVTGSVDSEAGADFKYRLATAATTAQELQTLTAITLSLTEGYNEPVVGTSVMVDYGGRRYIDRVGQVYHSIDPTNGAGIYAGTFDYATGNMSITSWVSGGVNTGVIKSLLTSSNYKPVTEAVFRVPIAPVKPESFALRCSPANYGGQINATGGADGTFSTPDMTGKIVYETGVVTVRFGEWVTAAGTEGEWWYEASAVEGGLIFEPKPVFANTILHNSVGFSYLPLSADILGLDPVRLPGDGRIPVYAEGDVVVILHDQTTVGTYVNATTTDLGRGRIAKLSVRDSANQEILAAKYTADLDAGTIDWIDLAGVAQPLTIVDRIEDMTVLTDVQITGTLTLSQPLTHNFPVTETLVSNAVIYGDLFATTSIPFDQSTWNGTWSDILQGSQPSAQYNNAQFPIVVDNASCIEERWYAVFINSTTVHIIGENVGQIKTSVSILSDIAPINPNTAQPYFTIPLGGWGAGWSAGNILRFNTIGANAPLWIIQSVGQGEATDTDYNFCIEVRGDVDTP